MVVTLLFLRAENSGVAKNREELIAGYESYHDKGESSGGHSNEFKLTHMAKDQRRCHWQPSQPTVRQSYQPIMPRNQRPFCSGTRSRPTNTARKSLRRTQRQHGGGKSSNNAHKTNDVKYGNEHSNGHSNERSNVRTIKNERTQNEHSNEHSSERSSEHHNPQRTRHEHKKRTNVTNATNELQTSNFKLHSNTVID